MRTEILGAQDIKRAAELLKAGELVAFPTETVYGLGALLTLPDALSKIYAVKGRPTDNPLIIHIADLSQVESLAVDIPEEFYQLAEAFFPGPLTIVLPRHESVSPDVSAQLPTIAIRMPRHALARSLLQEIGIPIAAPSANISGRPSSTHLKHVLADFDGKIAAVLDGGETEIGLESTVLSLMDPKRPVILRPGAVQQEQLQKLLKHPIVPFQAGDLLAAPGMKYRHYAPRASLKLFSEWEALLLSLKAPGGKRCLLSRKEPPVALPLPYLQLSAKDLYHHLRYADEVGYEEVLIFCCDEVLADDALMNRLTRAVSID